MFSNVRLIFGQSSGIFGTAETDIRFYYSVYINLHDLFVRTCELAAKKTGEHPRVLVQIQSVIISRKYH